MPMRPDSKLAALLATSALSPIAPPPSGGGVILWDRDPWHPGLDREVVRLDKPTTPRGWMASRGIDEFARPTLCILNGKPLMRSGWAVTWVKPGDLLQFHTLPAGGGGGGGKKNPLATVMSIAMMVVAPAIGAAIGSAIGLTGTAFSVLGHAVTWSKIIGGAVSLIGGALISAIFPAGKPATPSVSWGGGYQSTQAPSPTYSLQAQGNQARLGQPIPAIYGRTLLVPDLAAQPYGEYVDNEQYLYQFHAIGQGEYDVEAVRISDTSIGSFPEVEYEVLAPGVVPTLFETDVETAPEVGQQVLLGPNELDPGEDGWVGPFVINGSDTVASALAYDVICPRGLYYANSGGGLDSVTVEFVCEVREIDEAGAPVAGAAWAVLGAEVTASDLSALASDGSLNSTTTDFVAAGFQPGSKVTVSGFVSAANNGDFTVSSVTATKLTLTAPGLVDEAAGAAITATVTSESMTESTNTVQRKSYKFPVTPGRYEMRLKRLSNNQTDARYGDEIQWSAARAYLDSTPDYSGVTHLAVKARATNNLTSQSSRLVTVIVTRKLPVWDVATQSWSALTATRNPAWAVCDVARAEYGGKLADSRLALDDIATLADVWTARGDTFDGIFDSQSTVWDALSKICWVGRTAVYQQGGILRLVRDAAQSLPTMIFGRHNILKGSLKMRFVMPGEETADAVTLEYFSNVTWKPTEVTRRVRGADYDAWLTAEGLADSEAARDEWAALAENPARIVGFGITDIDHARNEAEFAAYQNTYRRIYCTFQTGLEARIPAYGDLVGIQHDMPRWGQGGVIEAWDSGTGVLTLSEPPEWTAGETHYIRLSRRDGTPVGPFEVTQVSATEVAVVGATLPFTPDTGGDRERTPFAFGTADADLRLARFIGARRRGPEAFEVVCAIEDDRVHVN